MKKHKRALEKAIKAVGNGTNLARMLKITRSAITQWDQVPVLKVLDVERLSGVPRHELRPDIYPPDLKRKLA